MAKQDDYVRYTIRIPAELYGRLKSHAGDKSVNAEIIERLEDTFAWETQKEIGEGIDRELKASIDRLNERLDRLEKNSRNGHD